MISIIIIDVTEGKVNAAVVFSFIIIIFSRIFMVCAANIL